VNLHRIQYETWLPRRETSLSLDIRKFLGSIKVTRISYKGMLSLYGGNFVDIFSAKKGVVVLAPKNPIPDGGPDTSAKQFEIQNDLDSYCLFETKAL